MVVYVYETLPLRNGRRECGGHVTS